MVYDTASGGIPTFSRAGRMPRVICSSSTSISAFPRSPCVFLIPGFCLRHSVRLLNVQSEFYNTTTRQRSPTRAYTNNKDFQHWIKKCILRGSADELPRDMLVVAWGRLAYLQQVRESPEFFDSLFQNTLNHARSRSFDHATTAKILTAPGEFLRGDWEAILAFYEEKGDNTSQDGQADTTQRRNKHKQPDKDMGGTDELLDALINAHLETYEGIITDQWKWADILGGLIRGGYERKSTWIRIYEHLYLMASKNKATVPGRPFPSGVASVTVAPKAAVALYGQIGRQEDYLAEENSPLFLNTSLPYPNPRPKPSHAIDNKEKSNNFDSKDGRKMPIAPIGPSSASRGRPTALLDALLEQACEIKPPFYI
eukprot:g32062.t1